MVRKSQQHMLHIHKLMTAENNNFHFTANDSFRKTINSALRVFSVGIHF